jgi:hypothetical protein
MTVTVVKTIKKKTCYYCGSEEYHPDLSCPRISAVDYYEDGTFARVEFVDWYGTPETEDRQPQPEEAG